MIEVILIILTILLVAFSMSISVQLVRIERLLKVIAVKASGDCVGEVGATLKRIYENRS